MNNTKKSLFNCSNEILKIYYSHHYNKQVIIEPTDWNLTIYFPDKELEDNVMEKVSTFLIKANKNWKIGVSSINNLFIKIW